MSLPHPSARLTLDGRTLTAPEAGLVALRVGLGLGSHDRAELVLWPGSALAAATPGAGLAVALGSGDEAETVWTGEVVAVAVTAEGVHLEGLSPTSRLSHLRRAETYLDRSVADIVRDLCQDLSLDEIQGDLELSAYSIDRERPVWEHLRDLAALTGADLGCAPGGGLRFVPPEAAGGEHTLRHGADILDWRLETGLTPPAPGAAAHGAGSEAGAGRWHWLRNDPVGAGGEPARVSGALRTREAVEVQARALAARAARSAVRGELWLGGHPRMRPGDRLSLEDLPGPQIGPLRVCAITHCLEHAGGYLSHLGVEAGETGGGLP